MYGPVSYTHLDVYKRQGWYRVLNGVNLPYTRLRLKGLCEDLPYKVDGESGIHYGSELMNAGLITTDASSGQAQGDEEMCRDFESRLYILKADQGDKQESDVFKMGKLLYNSIR